MTEKARILFVDDEKRVLNSMRGLFRREFELFLTTDGSDAVRMATENKIDVVVADQRMPGMSGIEVLGKVKELSPRTVRILLTGYADQNAVEGSINVGEVFRFLSKPCPPKVLRETLALAVAAARAKATAVPETAVAAQTAATPQPAAAPKAEVAVKSAAGAVPAAATKPAVADGTPEPAKPVQPAAPPVLVPEETGPPAAAAQARAAETEESEQAAASSHWDTVTEVVLSGDTCKEIQSPDVAATAAAMTRTVGVVIFTVDSAFAEDAVRAASADHSTTLATSLAKVAHSIEHHQAGVLVTDVTVNTAILQKMIGALKQRLPELVTIVVSGNRDTTDMINLINFGQVFRYVLKPVDAQTLRRYINAAAARHLQLRTNPDLVKRHEVQVQKQTSGSSETLSNFVDKIEKLRGRRFDPAGSV